MEEKGKTRKRGGKIEGREAEGRPVNVLLKVEFERGGEKREGRKKRGFHKN